MTLSLLPCTLCMQTESARINKYQRLFKVSGDRQACLRDPPTRCALKPATSKDTTGP